MALKEFSLALRRWGPVVFWAGLVLYASTGAGSSDRSGHFMRMLLAWFDPSLANAPLVEVNFYVRKTAHVVQFVIYAVLIWRGLSLKPPVVAGLGAMLGWVLGSAVALAFLSEGIQIFAPVRTPSLGDVALDFSGALIGVGLLFVAGFLRRPPPASPSLGTSRCPVGTILITSDLHLDVAGDRREKILADLRKAVELSGAGALVVAGDIGVADQAAEWLEALRRSLGEDLTLAICLGNHDHWLENSSRRCPTPESVRETFWRPACAAQRVHCLDFENLSLPGLTLCGGYGHYDFGFRDSDVVFEGRTPELADYRQGRFGGLVYPDMDRIPGLGEHDEAAHQAREISRRLAEASAQGQPILFLSHTIPFAALNGLSIPRGALPRFFDAYSGNSTIGGILSSAAQSIVFAASGHTHHPTPIRHLHGISCANTGSSPDQTRFLLFNPKSLTASQWKFPRNAIVV